MQASALSNCKTHNIQWPLRGLNQRSFGLTPMLLGHVLHIIVCCIILIHVTSTQMQPRFYHSRFTGVFVIALHYQSTLRLPDIYSTFVGLINSNYQKFIFCFSYMYLLFLPIKYRSIRLQVHYHIKSTSSSKRTQLSDLEGAHYFCR